MHPDNFAAFRILDVQPDFLARRPLDGSNLCGLGDNILHHRELALHFSIA
jgi:hypothetical protein